VEVTDTAPQPPPAPSDGHVAAPDVSRVRPRLWPAIVIVALQWLAVTVAGWVVPGTIAQFMVIMYAPMAGVAALALWWLFASRIRWIDRILGLLVFAAACGVATRLSDPSIGIFGMILYGLPIATTGWVVWMVLSFWLSWPVRRAVLLAAFVLGWACLDLIRSNGVDGSFHADMTWRWSKTEEEQFLAQRASAEAPAEVVTKGEALVLQPGDWPAFRGAARDSRLTGARIRTDWNENAPKLIWKQRIGPGWSSFAVIGQHLFTQEQRGESEVVICYNADTGKELWVHTDATRFSETVAGPGPRATPTFHEGKLYTLGANGALNCFDARTGKVVWSADVTAAAGAKPPNWGFSASPLVVRGKVIVHASGPEGTKSVLAYDAGTGSLAWSAGPERDHSYCSPQVAKLEGVEQVLLCTEAGLSSYDPADGAVLWQHSWPMEKDMARVVQPTVLDGTEGGTDILIGSPFGYGLRRVNITKDGGAWKDKEVYTSKAIKPYYNDLVIHAGHLYGFDGEFFTCVQLEDGESCWRARGYGSGQVLLLADQGILLVISEKGAVSLLKASPEKHEVIGRFQALEGKTWNHPVVAHGKLFVRNGREIACFDVAPAGGK
jgi:outer membrane protein assembly factor BamB